jgi:type II secretory pathway component PulF
LAEDFQLDLYGVSGVFIGMARVLAYNNVEVAGTIAGLIVAAILAVTILRSSPRGRILFDRIKLSVPLYGRCLMSGYMLRFSQTMGTLLKSRVPIGDAIYLTAESVGSESLKPAMDDLRQEVEGGARLSESLKKSGIFPDAAVWVLSAGDEKGQLDEALTDVSELYEAELERGAGRMAFWLEILATGLIALLVLCIVLIVYVPIIRLINSLGTYE